MSLRVALGQINVTVGDLAGNARRILAVAQAAHADGAHLLLTPELALCGYPPEDLLLRPAFLEACESSLADLREALRVCPGLTVVVGLPLALEGIERGRSRQAAPCLNGAVVLRDGQELGRYAKRELPNYQVFDERRYFRSGREAGLGPLVFEVAGRKLGLLICEDAWFDEPVDAAHAAGAEILAVINASPFHMGKTAEREARMAQAATRHGLPLLYAHLCGGQDEVVFDGASFALDAQGGIAARAPLFQEDLLLVDLDPQPRGPLAPLPELEAQVWQALVCGVRDYIGKNGFPGVVIGLSGGIDSALVLAIAVDALGADKVRAVMMPSPYTADISWIDARDMAERLGVRYDEIGISPLFADFNAALAPLFAGRTADTTEENLQARIRGTLLMALSNKFGSLVLTTGNKSEMATGYCTLYGDMAGGFAVIKDVAKTLVFRLARWRNREQEVIPLRIIERPPSAELRPDQKDEDSLPPYAVLDAILARYMEEDASVEQLLAEGFAPEAVERVTKLIKLSEYKRRQAPIGIRITHRSFGRDWRYPITNRFRA
ncbi:NAD+ synthase (glutamine-hydrolyzing) [Inhella inkyongensis]|uniref:Glutamine-dependent NAD(+) synthetase n=1 Tax=Inhella inkyongensis TaxID=392593 RepID=A0A840S4G9_9BURK|nr:NAD+ synthase [Inhella inkyongensis]MBB5203714.1 NAD+ synthase (glutamine-hydrolyzing) [Inhella inkyongensis]